MLIKVDPIEVPPTKEPLTVVPQVNPVPVEKIVKVKQMRFEVSAPKQTKNPYLKDDSIFTVSEAEILNTKKIIGNIQPSQKKDFMKNWVNSKKEGLREGLWKDSEMLIVRNYFSNLITDNNNRMNAYRMQLDDR